VLSSTKSTLRPRFQAGYIFQLFVSKIGCIRCLFSYWVARLEFCHRIGCGTHSASIAANIMARIYFGNPCQNTIPPISSSYIFENCVVPRIWYDAFAKLTYRPYRRLPRHANRIREITDTGNGVRDAAHVTIDTTVSLLSASATK